MRKILTVALAGVLAATMLFAGKRMYDCKRKNCGDNAKPHHDRWYGNGDVAEFYT